jgi:hypothetical protein
MFVYCTSVCIFHHTDTVHTIPYTSHEIVKIKPVLLTL